MSQKQTPKCSNCHKNDCYFDTVKKAYSPTCSKTCNQQYTAKQGSPLPAKPQQQQQAKATTTTTAPKTTTSNPSLTPSVNVGVCLYPMCNAKVTGRTCALHTEKFEKIPESYQQVLSDLKVMAAGKAIDSFPSRDLLDDTIYALHHLTSKWVAAPQETVPQYPQQVSPSYSMYSSFQGLPQNAPSAFDSK